MIPLAHSHSNLINRMTFGSFSIMNTILILSVACIAATTATHVNYRGGENYFGGAPQRELVDVPYTVEYRNTGSQGSAYGRNYQYEQKSYPQPEISRAELIYQNHQSSPRQEIQQIPYQTHSAPQVQAQYQPQRHYEQIPQQRTYSVPQQQHQQPTYQPSRQLVDVPYTTEVRRGHSAPVQPQRSYLPPQSQVVHQRTYSKPVQQQPQRQAKHYVDVPYTVETRSGGNSNAAAAGYRYSPLTSLQVQSPQPQRAQLVDVPYQVLSGGVSSGSHGGNYPVLPYTFGNSHSISTIGTGSHGFPTTPVGLSSLIY